MNTEGEIIFTGGMPATDAESADYLGANNYRKGDAHAEVKARVVKASSTTWALHELWRSVIRNGN